MLNKCYVRGGVCGVRFWVTLEGAILWCSYCQQQFCLMRQDFHRIDSAQCSSCGCEMQALSRALQVRSAWRALPVGSLLSYRPGECFAPQVCSATSCFFDGGAYFTLTKLWASWQLVQHIRTRENASALMVMRNKVGWSKCKDAIRLV